MTTKPSKVLIIGSKDCHSERSEESRGQEATKTPHPETLRYAQGDNNRKGVNYLETI